VSAATASRRRPTAVPVPDNGNIAAEVTFNLHLTAILSSFFTWLCLVKTSLLAGWQRLLLGADTLETRIDFSFAAQHRRKEEKYQR